MSSTTASSASAASLFTPIAIVGGGPAGLTAARVLQLHNIPCTVYENEAAPTARNQGGSLDLHAENGLWALEQCRLIEEFNKHSRPEGDCMRIMDKTGKLWHDEEPPPVDESRPLDMTPSGRPEIDRLALRNLLLDSLQPGTVQWGHALASLQPLPASAATSDGVPRWELTFKNGNTAQATIIIGADGTWSRIRPILSSTKPRYTGYTAIDFTVPAVSTHNPHLAKLVGPGTAFVLDDQRGLIAQMNGNDTLRAYAVLKVPEHWVDDTSTDGGAFLATDHTVSAQAVEALIARYFSGWNEAAMDLMRQADMQTVWVRRMYALPFDHSFAHDEQSRLVTAVGDAAHVMSVNGEGVNLAMMDAAQLALALANVLSPASPATATATAAVLAERLGGAIVECERAMFERSAALKDDPFNFDLFFGENGAVKFAEMLHMFMGGGGGGGGGEEGGEGDGAGESEKVVGGPQPTR